MKIIGGKLKGRNFYMPAGVRPTQGVTRGAIFNIIGQDVTGFEVLDLFAGSGAVGLEALSRGAKKAVFVERDPKCVEVIEENLRILGLKGGEKEPVSEILNSDAFAAIKALAARKRKFHVIFFDPPYGLDLGRKTLKTLGAYDILHPNCFVVAEYSRRDPLPDSGDYFKLVTQRNYGKAFLSVFEAGTPPFTQQSSDI